VFLPEKACVARYFDGYFYIFYIYEGDSNPPGDTKLKKAIFLSEGGSFFVCGGDMWMDVV